MNAPGAVPLALAPLQGAPLWRKEPYRPFFALGIAIAWAGVGQWVLFALHLTDYRAIFHAMAQVQGFLTCFVVGFLFTFIPRRTFGAPPAAWQMVVGLVCPAGVTIAAWFSAWAVSQVFWGVLLLTVFQFALSRMLASRNSRPAPASLQWVPTALAVGLVASVGTGVAAAVDVMWLHDVFRFMLLQGVVGGLVMGVGAMLVPVVTRAEPPRGVPTTAQRVEQFAWAAAFYASFFVEAFLPRLGLGLRAVVAMGVLVVGGQLWRPPTQPGLNRWLAWVAAWSLPVGYALTAAFPEHRSLGLHVVFLGCFGLLALAIGAHVLITHANRPEVLTRRSWPLRGLATALVGALACRALLELDPAHALGWTIAAAGLFLAATAAWLAFTLPYFALVPGPREH